MDHMEIHDYSSDLGFFLGIHVENEIAFFWGQEKQS